MKDVLADDINQVSDGWKRYQEKMKQITEEHRQSLPWTKLDYKDVDINEFDSLSMCGNTENIETNSDSLHMCGDRGLN